MKVHRQAVINDVYTGIFIETSALSLSFVFVKK